MPFNLNTATLYIHGTLSQLFFIFTFYYVMGLLASQICPGVCHKMRHSFVELIVYTIPQKEVQFFC